MSDWSSSPWYQAAIDAANRFGIPTDLFTAQIGQESGFNPNAVNGNAQGIAQFMPGTARDFNLNPFDAQASLNAAAQYDQQLHSQYGSWATALEHYGTTANGNAPDVAALAASKDSGNFWGLVGGLSDFIFSSDFSPSAATADMQRGAAGHSTTGTVVTGVGDLLAIITDIPRMVTIIAGLILLIAGLFMLGARPAVQIVSKVKDTAGAVAELAA